MNINIPLSGRETALVSEIESLGVSAELLARVALNRLFDDLIDGDGNAPTAADLQDHLIKEYGHLIEKHGGGRGVSIHAQRNENEEMNAFVMKMAG